MGVENSKEIKLTPEELNGIHHSWDLVMKSPEENGCFILKTFLDRHNYYYKFHKFEGIPRNEIIQHKVFRNHGLAIVNQINKVILHLNRSSGIKADLINLGKSHGKRRVVQDQFQELKLVILEILEVNFDATATAILAWNKAFDLAFQFIFEGIRSEI